MVSLPTLRKHPDTCDVRSEDLIVQVTRIRFQPYQTSNGLQKLFFGF